MSHSFNDLIDKLNLMGSNVKITLNQIQDIDIACLKIQVQLQQKRNHYLEMLQQKTRKKQLKQNQQEQSFIQNSESEEVQNSQKNCTEEELQLKQIHQLQAKLRELTREKIYKTEQISSMVENTYIKSQSVFVQILGGQPIHEEHNIQRKKQIKQQILQYQLNSLGLRKKKGRQKFINPRVQSVYEKYYQMQSQQTVDKYLCICNQVNQTEPMIMCQNLDCPIQWYHMRCLGMDEKNIPQGEWFCPKCISQIDKFNKIKFFDSYFQYQVKVEKDQQEKNQEIKRGKGRPRKNSVLQSC